MVATAGVREELQQLATVSVDMDTARSQLNNYKVGGPRKWRVYVRMFVGLWCVYIYMCVCVCVCAGVHVWVCCTGVGEIWV